MKVDTATSKKRAPHHGYANKSYAAEDMARRKAWRKNVPLISRLEARQWIDTICILEGWEMIDVTFYKGGWGTGWATPSENRVRFSTHGLCQTIVIHELAHLSCGEAGGHGPIWRAELVRLAEEYLPNYARSLKVAFRHYDLDWE